uniref:Uncharacterized protein n=1 Tax=Enterobacter cloacae TaxID=550 RepID=A0A4P8GLQ5_ENTCL|nr:hypothetical protein [Enterobacter cloacae]
MRHPLAPCRHKNPAKSGGRRGDAASRSASLSRAECTVKGANG